MIDAISIFVGCAFLIRSSRGIHQSSALSEINSQFHDDTSAPSRPWFIDSVPVAGFERVNFVLGPATFTTGCIPMVFTTTPPQPASNARMMFVSDSVGGAEDSRNGFSNLRPVKFTERSTAMRGLLGLERGQRTVGFRTAVAIELPGRAHLIDHVEIKVGHHDRVLVSRVLRDD